MKDKNIKEVKHILNVMAKSFTENKYENVFVKENFKGLNSRKNGYKISFTFSISWFSSEVMVKVKVRNKGKVLELIGCTSKDVINMLEKHLNTKFKEISLSSKYDNDTVISVVTGI